ncbi:Nodule Cysteine-Rich (NCR) secreted peptide [Medicago truncatula]|uniref:Nodule Cysteine-Rich (NCR) secreted peptide n=2 Tax=Medicago truncatula TaxID=3880 RepID=G7K8Z9_MEDTR|nr:Nodule Cysteine-Rich (NCR) secreted peptide [Medicago truncatula]
MAKTIKFVYTMILFLSLFIVAKEVHAYPGCETDAECPKIYELYPLIYKCENKFCILSQVLPYIV